ncbi:membrane protein [Arsukibacterium ikkense]|uniref:Membrane protein n=1 Tax=Arsukibacterium ikkense TaxID=336831 RepID=A0A0M2V7S7_9GAMM|nr:outer membrane beta-barrel protein [Arsukibacterium ikkense]KKO45203.1 membrane protein [Arsukibacterium ikkense]
MFKKISCLAVIAALSSTSALANEGLYIGGQLSSTKLKVAVAGESDSESFNVLSGLAGYKFNPYFALEARLGKGISDQSATEDGFRESISVSHQNAFLAKGIVPINDVFSMYGVAGFAAVKYKFKESGDGFSASASETIDGFSAGVGAAFNLNSQLSLTIEYLQLPNKKYSVGPANIKLKTNSVTAGINYAF